MEIIKKYLDSLQAIYDHVGFTEDWVVCPIDDATQYFWQISNSSVKFSETMEKFNSEGDFYRDDIYTQRFYNKHVFAGKDFTMVFCDPRTDGMKWFRIFDNSKQIKEF